MDTETIVIGHGRGSRYRNSHPANQGVNRRNQHHNGPRELVQVYNGSMDNPVGTIPLKTLVRFSRVAREKFPKPEELKKLEGNTPAAAENPTAAAGQKTYAPVSAPTGRGRAAGRGRGQTAGAAKAGVEAAASSPRPQRRLPTMLQLVVTIPERILPSNLAIETAMQWMRDNARSDKVTPLGASETDLMAILDLYQAVVAFQIMPAQRHLPDTLVQFLESWTPALEAMIMFNEHLPLNDRVITAMGYAHDRAYMSHEYSTQEIADINAEFWGRPENKAFADKLDYIGRERKRQRRAKQNAGSASKTNAGYVAPGAGNAKATRADAGEASRVQTGQKSNPRGKRQGRKGQPKKATSSNAAAAKGGPKRT